MPVWNVHPAINFHSNPDFPVLGSSRSPLESNNRGDFLWADRVIGSPTSSSPRTVERLVNDILYMGQREEVFL